MSDEPEWYYPHMNDLPCDNRAVAVLVGLKDGTFYADIGRFNGKDGWQLQSWSGSAVVAWSNIPSFAENTEIVEHGDATVTSQETQPSEQSGESQ